MFHDLVFFVRIETLKKNYWVSKQFVIGGSTEEVSMFEGRGWPTIPKKRSSPRCLVSSCSHGTSHRMNDYSVL